MKKITFFLCFLFFLLAVPASAREILLPAGETVNHDFLAAAGEGDFLGTVNGDAFLAGGNLQISGPVNGDLLASFQFPLRLAAMSVLSAAKSAFPVRLAAMLLCLAAISILNRKPVSPAGW